MAATWGKVRVRLWFVGQILLRSKGHSKQGHDLSAGLIWWRRSGDGEAPGRAGLLKDTTWNPSATIPLELSFADPNHAHKGCTYGKLSDIQSSYKLNLVIKTKPIQSKTCCIFSQLLSVIRSEGLPFLGPLSFFDEVTLSLHSTSGFFIGQWNTMENAQSLQLSPITGIGQNYLHACLLELWRMCMEARGRDSVYSCTFA